MSTRAPILGINYGMDQILFFEAREWNFKTYYGSVPRRRPSRERQPEACLTPWLFRVCFRKEREHGEHGLARHGNWGRRADAPATWSLGQRAEAGSHHYPGTLTTPPASRCTLLNIPNSYWPVLSLSPASRPPPGLIYSSASSIKKVQL